MLTAKSNSAGILKSFAIFIKIKKIERFNDLNLFVFRASF